jgi:hypothetical protein
MKRIVLAALAGWLAFAATGSDAASAQRWLYVVNATGRPFHMALDGEAPSPEMAHLVGAMRPVALGNHVLSGQVVGEPGATTKLDLTEASSVTLQEEGNDADVGIFWCVVVGRRPGAELAFITVTQPECAKLLQDLAEGLKKKPAN